MAIAVAAFVALGSINIPNPTHVQPQGFSTAYTHSSGRLTYGNCLIKLTCSQDAKALSIPVCAAGSNVSVRESSINTAATSFIGEERRRRGRPKTFEASTTTNAVSARGKIDHLRCTRTVDAGSTFELFEAVVVVSRKKKVEGKQVVNGVHTEESKAYCHEVDHHEEKSKGSHLFPYGEGPWDLTLCILDDLPQVFNALADQVVKISEESIKLRGHFTIVLSGGSLVKALTRLAEKPYSTKLEWEKWHVFWADERMVPISHSDSNYNSAKNDFLSKVPIPHNQLHTIDDWDVTSAAAHGYENSLKDLVKGKVLATVLVHRRKYPRFDLVLLGIGPDGHIASMFPNSLELAETRQWVVPISKSAKPPPRRISLTLPCINSAVHVIFVVFGLSKAEVLQRVFERPALPGALPAQMVRPSDGHLTWLVDKQAASTLAVKSYDDPKQFPSVDWSSLKKSADKKTATQ